MSANVLGLLDWRRRVAALYAEVRAQPDPAVGHARWRVGRDALFREHPQSPLPPDDPLRSTGLPYWPWDPAWRFTATLEPAVDADARLELDAGEDAGSTLRPVGRVRLPAPLDAELTVWWLESYGGGLFVPLRDGTAGRPGGSYGGGRYLLDTVKGADLGGTDALVLDLNFAYHPSCRYDPRWVCPLAPPGNTVSVPVEAGERMPRDDSGELPTEEVVSSPEFRAGLSRGGPPAAGRSRRAAAAGR